MGRPKATSREGILAATLEVFRERGYEGVTVPAIARRCGVSQGTLYNYFPSKERLLFACARAAGTPGTIFATLCEDIGRRPTAELLEEGAVGVARFLELRLPAILIRAARPQSSDRPGIEFPRRAMESVRDYFAAEIRAGRIRRSDPEALAWGFMGGLFYYAFFERLYGLPRSFSPGRERHARTFAREFARGVTRGHASAGTAARARRRT